MLDLNEPYEFDWDQGNTVKNLVKHNIECRQAEESFLDDKSLLGEDPEHSNTEKRFQLIGKDHQGIVLYVVFTQRKRKIRVISVRIANKKERRFYEQDKKV
ncbi:MAG: BrnT family toxin [Candidatus Shapirobacteria bacterium]|nr:BrnT family toxin [Candidatus Shapirobacteria bacterium]